MAIRWLLGSLRHALKYVVHFLVLRELCDLVIQGHLVTTETLPTAIDGYREITYEGVSPVPD
jgi:hypothetical protein